MPWALLVAGSVASLAANVAVAEPTMIGRVIAAWPSFALTASYGLSVAVARAATCNGRHGGGRWPTVAMAEPCQAGWQLPSRMAVTNGGAVWSRAPAWPALSAPTQRLSRAWARR
jgi:hypothetical protein